MSSPNVTVIWDDQSQINAVPVVVEDTVDRPIVMVAGAFAKGPEEWKKKIFGEDLVKLYGKSSFSKFGQVSIQTANLIQSGGYATIKRIVAEDSKLANIGVVANVTYTETQYMDPDTKMFLWEKKDTSTGIVNRVFAITAPASDYSAVKVNQVNVSFEIKSFPVAGNDINYFRDVMYSTYKSTNKIGNADRYPLFLLTDMGRGVSNKRIRIYRDNTNSYPITYARYFIEIREDDEVLETLSFSINPDVIEYSEAKGDYININLQNAIRMKSKQLRCVFFDGEYRKMCKNVSYLLNTWTGVDTTTPFKDAINEDQFALLDTLFGTDFYGERIPYLTINSDLDNIFGIPLQNGSDGSFGKYDSPLDDPSYKTRLKKAFTGDYGNEIRNADEIYDLDNNRIDAIFDADYPPAVKNAIEQLAVFREDLVYFRDMGRNISNIANMKSYIKTNNLISSRFVASYCNSYDIYDPFTKKQVNVTIMYHLVSLFVTHFINGRSRPFCGSKYGVILPIDEIIDGTINFFPKIIPSVDQKTEMDTLRINYCAYYDGNLLSVNSCYTSQTKLSQLSWVNNVLAVQEIIKAIRVICPKIRYTFTDGDDLVQYKKDIQDNVITRYSSNFKKISIEYIEDDLYDINKIIYAVIYVQFRNFVQSEVFKITAIQS